MKQAIASCNSVKGVANKFKRDLRNLIVNEQRYSVSDACDAIERKYGKRPSESHIYNYMNLQNDSAFLRDYEVEAIMDDIHNKIDPTEFCPFLPDGYFLMPCGDVETNGCPSDEVLDLVGLIGSIQSLFETRQYNSLIQVGYAIINVGRRVIFEARRKRG